VIQLPNEDLFVKKQDKEFNSIMKNINRIIIIKIK